MNEDALVKLGLGTLLGDFVEVRTQHEVQPPDWPAGFYLAAPGFAVGVVVLPELPKTRETLPLRMFGDDDVRRGLRAEFEALDEADPMRQALGRMLACWSLWVRGQPQDERTQRRLMDFNQVAQNELNKLVQGERSKIHDEGVREGVREGLRVAQAAVVDLCGVLGIEMTPERQAHLGSLDLAGLDALRAHLKSHRSWPAA